MLQSGASSVSTRSRVAVAEKNNSSNSGVAAGIESGLLKLFSSLLATWLISYLVGVLLCKVDRFFL